MDHFCTFILTVLSICPYGQLQTEHKTIVKYPWDTNTEYSVSVVDKIEIMKKIKICNLPELDIQVAHSHGHISVATWRQHGHYITCQDDRIQQGPNLSAGVSEAHDLS